ncbi:MAG TPA: ROK family protein [Cytophagaceae bacterium]
MILGIDVGGTTVKFGIVSPEGEITHIKDFNTHHWAEEGFVDALKAAIAGYLEELPGIKGVGIGWPGLLSVDRRTVILLPNIPSVVNLPVVDMLEQAFPQLTIRIENDAKCAALGELYFGGDKELDNFILVAMGTGVGSGVIINKKIFLGARGNGTEIGHMLSREGKTVEQHLGLNQIIEFTRKKLELDKSNTSILHGHEITPKEVYEAAKKGDELALSVWEHVGTILGENLVSVIRVLDLNTILLGGGVAGAFEFIAPAAKKVLLNRLPAYYTDTLTIRKAVLTNKVGLLGAAGLLMSEEVFQ